jgi:hypothetical protein
MRQSTAVICRAVVMLSCLIAIPLAALFGTSLPDVVKMLREGHFGGDSTSSREVYGEAPRFVGSRTDVPPTASVPGPADQPQWGMHPASAPRSDTPRNAAAGRQPSGTIPASYDALPKRLAPPAAAGAAVAGEPNPSNLGDERFLWIQQRLRRLGATYYLLEAWGGGDQLYRFHCRMALAGSPGATRHFEATDRDPFEAMSKVLREVEAWRAGR